jgi:hypothetical protein
MCASVNVRAIQRGTNRMHTLGKTWELLLALLFGYTVVEVLLRLQCGWIRHVKYDRADIIPGSITSQSYARSECISRMK